MIISASFNLCRNGGNPFILTATVRKSFEMVFLAVSQRWPVLLYGPGGVGKTAMINKLAQDHRSQGTSFNSNKMLAFTLHFDYVVNYSLGYYDEFIYFGYHDIFKSMSIVRRVWGRAPFVCTFVWPF